MEKISLTFVSTNFATIINNDLLIKFTESFHIGTDEFLTEVLSISVEALLLNWGQWLDGLRAMVRIRVRLV